jgi:integrase
LNLLFRSEVYTDKTLPRGQASEAAYWVPLLGPLVGGRIEELAQLRIDDVERINGDWCLRICDLGEDQTIKTKSSFRRVPLHALLMKCGFLAFVARQAKAGHERVFHTLSNENANGTWSNALGKWYGRHLDKIGLSDRRLDFHSNRYTFRQQCSLCGIQNEVRDALTGHWSSNRDAGRTYMRAHERQYPLPLLVAAMSALRYDELRLDHLYVDEPMRGVQLLLK